MREHKEMPEAPYRRLAPARWELLAYVMLLAAAFALAALQFPKWVAVPLVLAVLGVRAVRIWLERAFWVGYLPRKRMKGRVPGNNVSTSVKPKHVQKEG